ncbi:MAG: 50S ribosomal protein L25 [bacterium]
MAEADLHVELREKTGPQIAKTLRRSGRVPGIFYFHNVDSIPLSVDEKELQRLANSEINIINVFFPDGKSQKSILREVQKDPVTDALIHVDIMGIDLTEKVRLSIPVILVGTPVGVKEGGILEHLVREVTVEGLPLDIPEHIEVDVSGLNIGDVITLETIPAEKFRFVTEIHHGIVHVIHPKVVKEEAEIVAEAEVGAEDEAAGSDKEGEKEKE